MSTGAVLNATQKVSGEIFGISGNLLAALIVLAGVLIAVVMFFIVRWLQKKADSTTSQIDDIIIASIGTPAVIAVLVISVFAALQVAALPTGLEWIVESKYFNAIYVIIGAWIVSGFVYNFISIYGSRVASETESDIDDRMIALALVVSKYLIWFVAFLLILGILEIDITPFLAAAGIIGLAFALAAQDILSNFFGGAIIAVDKPFKLHDRIKINEYVGDVMHVGPRSTRLKTLDNQIITIPNSTITNSFVVNYAMPDAMMKIRVPIGVAYGTDIPQVKKAMTEIAHDLAKSTSYILANPEPVVYFLEFGESSLKFELVLWTNDVTKSWEVKDAVNMRIAERFAEEKIEIPFPQMDVHLKGI
jgi:small-conductance mechanosensitive channel